MSRRTNITNSKIKTKEILQVVVLVLQNNQNDVLITQRRKDAHLGGYWEFPGGKIEANETPQEALRREINEELAYTPQHPEFLQYVDHDYEAFSVRLHVFIEHAVRPEVNGNENQAWRWCPVDQLSEVQLPAANHAIVTALLHKHHSA